MQNLKILCVTFVAILTLCRVGVVDGALRLNLQRQTPTVIVDGQPVMQPPEGALVINNGTFVPIAIVGADPKSLEATTEVPTNGSERSLFSSFSGMFGGAEHPSLSLDDLEDFDAVEHFDKKLKKKKMKDKHKQKQDPYEEEKEKEYGKDEYGKPKMKESELKKNLKKLKLEEKKMKHKKPEYEEDGYGAGGGYKKKTKEGYEEPYVEEEYEEEEYEKPKMKPKMKPKLKLKMKPKKKPKEGYEDEYEEEEEYAPAKPEYPPPKPEYAPPPKPGYGPPPPKPGYAPPPPKPSYEAPPPYPGAYKVDPNPKGKYIPQYRQTGVNQTEGIQTRGSYQSASSYAAPPAPAPSYSAPPAPAPSYSAPPAPAPSYSAPPAPAPSYSAPAPPPPKYSAPAPAQTYSAPSPPAPKYSAPAPKYPAPTPSYSAPPAAVYDSSAYDTAYTNEEYERAKMKVYPVKLVQTQPALEVNTYDVAADYTVPLVPGADYSAATYNYSSPAAPSVVYQSGQGYGAAPVLNVVPYAAGSKDYAPPAYAPPAPAPYAAPAPKVPKVSVLPASFIKPPAYSNPYLKPEYNMPVAVANLFCTNPKYPCSCTLYLTQINKLNMLISGVCSGLKKDKHYALNLFESGDITGGCGTIGGHYNPLNSVHGHMYGPTKHMGDLGNIKSDANGVAFINKLKRDALSILCGRSGYSILGRSLGISDAKDDYGLGGSYRSLKTGNSGKVIACGVIGLASKENSYETREMPEGDESTPLPTPSAAQQPLPLSQQTLHSIRNENTHQ